MVATRDTCHFQMSPLNDVASLNIPHMSITSDTSHFDMSALNDVAPRNIELMLITRDTSHVPIGPSGLFEQFPFDDSSRHASTLFFSDENIVANAGHTAVDINPGELKNM